MLKKAIITVLAVAAAAMVATSASVTDANKACADGIETFRRLFISDSAMARSAMQALQTRLSIPDDLTFADVVEAIRMFGAERIVSEVAEGEALNEGLDPDGVNKAKAPKLSLMKDYLPEFKTWPDVYDQFFLFRGVTAVQYN